MKRILSISLAVLILASSLGLTIATHYCGGHIMDSAVAFGHTDLGCDMGLMDDISIDFNHENNIRSTTCCENEFVAIELDDQFKSSVQKVSINPVFLAVYANALLGVTVFENTQNVAYLDYNPPPLIANFQIEHQTLLI